MRLTHIEAQGLRSLRDLVSLDITDKTGVVSLRGDNGHGKSSLWEAVCWCLYGRTSRGLKGPDIATWEHGRGIYAHVNVNGRKVVRTWNPITCTLDGDDATQDQLDQVIGLTFEQFLRTHYFAQHVPSFLDVGASMQTDLLASVLGLDQWLDRSAAASKKASAQQRVVATISDRLHGLRCRKEELEATDYQEACELWWERHALKGAELKRTIASQMHALQDAEALVEREAATLAGREAHESVCAEAFEAAEARYRKLREKEDEIREQCQHAEGGECPTCGVLSMPEDSLAELTEKAEAIGQRTYKARLAVDAARNAKTAARVATDFARGEYATAKANAGSAQRALTRARDDVKDHWQEVCPLDEAAAAKEKRLRELAADIDEVGMWLAEAEEQAELYTYWVKGFKDVRLFLVAEALTQLEVEVNSALSEVGLHDWAIEFSPDSETKGGDIKRGMSAYIKSPANARPVRWDVWSGGEAQRLRNATSMGLSNLITAYTGIETFVEVWDEPTHGMNDQGVTDLLAALKSRAETQGKQIWLIDHRAFNSGAFIDSLTAVKRDGTTTFERY